MKYPIGTVIAARMVGSQDPDDNVRATLTKSYGNGEYRMSIEFQIRPHTNYEVTHHESLIDEWLADNWYVEYNPNTVIKLDEELFTI